MPYLFTEKNPISWQKPLQHKKETTFLNLKQPAFEDIFSLSSYLRRYGHVKGNANLQMHMEEFDDWRLVVPFGKKKIDTLCCPEDRRCIIDECVAGTTMCTSCEVPFCKSCNAALQQTPVPLMPKAALGLSLIHI